MDLEVGRIELLDSIDLNEATLTKMTPDQAERFAKMYPGLRLYPERILYPMRLDPMNLVSRTSRPRRTGAIRTLVVRAVEAGTKQAVPDAELVIVFDSEKRVGLKNIRTDAEGLYEAALPASLKTVDAVVCVPLKGYWAAKQRAIKVAGGNRTEVTIELVPIEQGFRDALDRTVRPSRPEDGRGVKIGIVDAGVSPGDGLKVKQGLNTTGTEPADLWSDNGSGHGTHVAGIVARLAPAAELFAYRVFKQGTPGAEEFAIARAIRKAVEDGCDIINLSLGQTSEPFAITREVRRARALGVVCVAATGNGGMEPVAYPARTAGVTAVTAAGVLGSWPKGAMTGDNVAPEPKAVAPYFFAAFSNIGEEVDFIAPGVGIVSWVEAAATGIMDGTSMACPAVVGLMARSLSQNTDLLNADRDQQRSDDILKQVNEQAAKIGFGNDFEGMGLIEAP